MVSVLVIKESWLVNLDLSIRKSKNLNWYHSFVDIKNICYFMKLIRDYMILTKRLSSEFPQHYSCPIQDTGCKPPEILKPTDFEMWKWYI